MINIFLVLSLLLFNITVFSYNKLSSKIRTIRETYVHVEGELTYSKQVGNLFIYDRISYLTSEGVLKTFRSKYRLCSPDDSLHVKAQVYYNMADTDDVYHDMHLISYTPVFIGGSFTLFFLCISLIQYVS